jgi:hypothetical protein
MQTRLRLYCGRARDFPVARVRGLHAGQDPLQVSELSSRAIFLGKVVPNSPSLLVYINANGDGRRIFDPEVLPSAARNQGHTIGSWHAKFTDTPSSSVLLRKVNGRYL